MESAKQTLPQLPIASAQSAWQPGPAENVLPGIIPRPAKLPGIGRWQVETALPRSAIEHLAWSPDGRLIARETDAGNVRVHDAGNRSSAIAVVDTETGQHAWLCLCEMAIRSPSTPLAKSSMAIGKSSKRSLFTRRNTQRNAGTTRTDGRRGDDDLAENRIIFDPSGPAVIVNTPPVADAGGPYVEYEGDSFQLDGSTTSDAEDLDGSLTFEWDLDFDGTTFDVDTTGIQPTVSFSDDFAQRTIALRVTDSGGLSDIGTTTLEILNAEPIITELSTDATMADRANEQETVTVNATFTDAGTGDGHTATLDWGDGSMPQEFSWDPTGAAASIEATHAYSDGGIYTVTLTVADDDGASTSQTTTAIVSGAGVNDRTLFILGTAGRDRVSVHRHGRDGLKVHTDFLPDRHRSYQKDTFDQIIVYLFEGNDVFLTAGNVTTPIIVHGGAGNDLLNAGRGPAVLLGDDGRDTLLGGKGLSILIGGGDRDFLFGGRDEDLLIGGRLTVADNDAALLQLLSEWNAPEDYATRVDHLRQGTGASGIRLERGVNVLDDELDVLIGGTGLDWFFTDDFDRFLGKKRDKQKN